MIKLIAIDLDGTLLNSKGEVSNKDKQAIKKAKQKGVEIVLASGRMPETVENIAREIGADKYMICGNGAFIYDIQNQKRVHECFLEKEKVLKIIKMCEENSVYYNVCTQNYIITKSLNYNTMYYHNSNLEKPLDKRTQITLIQDIYNYIKKNNQIDVLKIEICDENKIIFDGILKKIKEITDISILEVKHKSKKELKLDMKNIPIEYYYTEILNKNTNKWTAIQYLMNIFGINKSEVMAIGDNANDIEMITNSGIGVTMGKSILEQNNIGDFVTLDNDLSGVSVAINKYLE